METPPFKYEVVDHFLEPDQLEALKTFYSTLTFKEIRTDLFAFLQSCELNEDPRLDELKSKLDAVFSPRVSEPNTFYSVFASYYRKGDFLLCHDDMVDERMWAFSLYLEDFDSGDLILYENDCETIHERVAVHANRLVIFEVSEKSFHEVDMCMYGGRKAITGWINAKDKKVAPRCPTVGYNMHENIEFFDLGIDLDASADGLISLDFTDVEVKEISRKLLGPFTDRRAYASNLEVLYAPYIEGYKLISAECLFFKDGCYLLCNDRVNSITEGVFDVFIFSGCKTPVKGFLSYVEQDASTSLSIDAVNNRMVLGRRNGHSICIGRTSSEVFVKHFIYIATDSPMRSD